MSLFDASVDLNPHQIEAAMFALKSPLSKGLVLADEVGLGKTIEAGLVLCQYWAERRRRLLVVCPASLRKQWSLELEEKFNLPTVAERVGLRSPAVRQILLKLWRAAKDCGFPPPEREPRKGPDLLRNREDARARYAERTTERRAAKEVRKNQRLLEQASRDAKRYERLLAAQAENRDAVQKSERIKKPSAGEKPRQVTPVRAG
jgi:hypothetical protein